MAAGWSPSRPRRRSRAASVRPPDTPRRRALLEEAEQLAVVRNRRRDDEVIDAGRTKAPPELHFALRGAAVDVGAPEVDEARLAGLHVDETRERAGRESFLARIDDRQRDHVMLAIQSIQRTLGVEI